jgi:beta-lactamase class A
MQAKTLMLDGENLGRLAEQHKLDRAAVVVEPLDGRGAASTYRANRPLYPASMIKVPLVAAALMLHARGRVAARVRVSAANLTQNDGASPFAPDYDATIEELCTLAITRSDNIATNELFDLVGRERASRLVREELGLRDTGFRRKLSGGHPLVRDAAQTGRNTFPASDAATMFRAVANDAFAGAAFLCGLLERQEWNTKLSAGIRAGDTFAHKTGDTETVSHDGGILTTALGRRFIVVVYSGSPSSEATDARFAAFMRDVRAILEEARER